MIKHIRAVIFDCDGVLFDTQNANTAYYNHLLSHFDLPPMTRQQFEYTHMHTVDESLAHLFDDAELREAAHQYRLQMSYQPFLKHMEIEPHLKPLLNRLRPRFKTAIATNRTDTMNRVLEEYHIQDAFDLVVTAADVPRPKPYPDPLIRVLTVFNLEPHQALYVGDSQVDQTAADAAGIPLVAFGNDSLSAAYHIQSLKEMESLLLASN